MSGRCRTDETLYVLSGRLLSEVTLESQMRHNILPQNKNPIPKIQNKKEEGMSWKQMFEQQNKL